ncbi:MAG: type II secretion system protein GspM [Burkholderiaceae bacterium]
MLEALLQRWQLLVPRERRMLLSGALLLAVLLVYFVLYEPASDGRRRLAGELPALRAQLASVEQLAGEARRLGAAPVQNESPQRLKTQLEQSIDAAGLKPALAQLSLAGELFDLRFKGVSYGAWLAWLDSAVRETRLRVVDVAVTREAAPGAVSARVTLELPRREGR